MNRKEYVQGRLKSFKKKDIVITPHVKIRALQRQLELDEIKENIINPHRLEFAVEEKPESAGEEKFDCYFGYSKTQCHRYVLVISKNVVVVTAIKINRRWQRIAETKLRRTKG